MEEFRELVLLLKNYAADEHIEVYDRTSIKQVPFWHTQNGQGSVSNLEMPEESSSEQSFKNGPKFLPPKVRQRLWSTLLFLDSTQEDTHEPQRVAYLCWQRLAVLKTLLSVGATKSLREMAEALLHTAKTYELTIIIIETAALLRQFCALHDGNTGLFAEYCRLIHQQEKLLEAEQAANDEYCAFLACQIKADVDNQLLIHQAHESCLKLEQYMPENVSSSFLINYYYLKLQAAFLEMQWARVVAISIQAEKVLLHKSVCMPEKIGAFALTKALGQANVGELEAALITLESALDRERPGTSNWYRIQELKLSWLLHQGAYPSALNLVRFLDQKNKYPAWSMEQKQFYHSVMLILDELGLLSLSRRHKGMFLTNYLPVNQPHFSSCSSLLTDNAAAILILRLPKWSQQGGLEELLECLQEYLKRTKTQKSNTQRLEILIEGLKAVQRDGKAQRAWNQCLEELKKWPLDYSSPEAALEILSLESIIKCCIS